MQVLGDLVLIEVTMLVNDRVKRRGLRARKFEWIKYGEFCWVCLVGKKD